MFEVELAGVELDDLIPADVSCDQIE